MNDTTNEVKIPFCRKDWSEDGVAAFTFSNGEEVSFNVNNLSDEIKFELMMHGVMQKCGDSYASAKGDFVLAKASLQKVIDQLEAGNWSAARSSPADGAPKAGELAQAIATLKGLPLNAVADAVARATEDQRKAWRKNAAIAAEIARARAERAAARAAKATATGTADDIDLG